ncbi:hypothetical protein [Streptomyces murinus]|uniref:hypothetical protein n=1 Tax=Streptomyces murinus TaxID=33900 RepID=UPI002E0E9E4E|nr:hypothetical protein OG516_25965 [Streptomyces murinus]
MEQRRTPALLREDKVQVTAAKMAAQPAVHGSSPVSEAPRLSCSAAMTKTITDPRAAAIRVRFERFGMRRTLTADIATSLDDLALQAGEEGSPAVR